MFSLQTKFSQIISHHQFILLGIALFIGLIAGSAEVLFRLGIIFVRKMPLFLVEGGAAPWLVVFVPAIGGLFVGVCIHYFLPLRRPHSVADVIEANAHNSGKMSLKTGLVAAMLSATSIGVGASVGREGPIIHLGASLSSWVAQLFHLPASMTRTILGCGIAGAVASAFNAPIAGVFFALEVVIGHYALGAFTPIVLSAVVATFFSHWQYGAEPSFTLSHDLVVATPFELPLFIVLGVCAAVIGIVLNKSIFGLERAWSRVAFPAMLRPMVAGLAIGVIGCWYPQVMGVGYEVTSQALNEQLPFILLGVLCLVKIIATALSLGSGFCGGIFSPSLMIGALFGGVFGLSAAHWIDFMPISSPGIYSILGMGAVAGAVMGAPISTILIVFEMTGSYGVTMAVMVAVGVAATIMHESKMKSFFHQQLMERGVVIEIGRYAGILRGVSIAKLMSQDYVSVSPTADHLVIAEALERAPMGVVWVVDKDKDLHGMITLPGMVKALAVSDSDHGHEAVTAESLMETNLFVLEQDESLKTAMVSLERYGQVVFPVVDDKSQMKICGVLYSHQLLQCYQQEIRRARAEERGDLVPPPLYR